jgi:hypothetical protein
MAKRTDVPVGAMWSRHRRHTLRVIRTHETIVTELPGAT